MGCPRCGRENPSDGRYCAGCGALLAETKSEETDPLVGRVLDRVYRIDRVIARGGMGIVYLGTNTRLDQEVAIKVLGQKLASDSSIDARFKHEAKTQARLRHPGIVAVTDFVVDGSVSAIVMEYAPGDTLADVATRWGALPVERLVAIFVPVLEALEYAHSQGVTHRDIKPSNIILTRSGAKEIPKLTDFGIAKAVQTGARLTATGSVMGTLEYMAPEQCANTKDVDHRADIYALGVTIYEAATGRVPFQATNPAELITRHLTEKPIDPRAIRAELPEPLAQLVLRALEKRPEDRFASAQEMMTALQAATLERTVPELTVPTPVPRHVIPQTQASPVPELAHAMSSPVPVLDPNLPQTAPIAPVAVLPRELDRSMSSFGRPSRSFADPSPPPPDAKKRIPFAVAPAVTLVLVVLLLVCAFGIRTCAEVLDRSDRPDSWQG